MSLWDDLFGGGTGSASKSMQDQIQRAIAQYRQSLSQAEGRVSPYEKVGYQGLLGYNKMLNQMSDPVAYEKQILGSYSGSPDYKFRQHEGMQQLINNAAATGLTGSGKLSKDMMKYSQGLASQGQQQYLQNTLGIGKQYLGGEQNLGNMGYRAATQLGDWDIGGAKDLAGLYGSLGQAKSYGNLGRSNMFQNIMQMLSHGLMGKGGPFAKKDDSSSGEGGFGGFMSNIGDYLQYLPELAAAG